MLSVFDQMLLSLYSIASVCIQLFSPELAYIRFKNMSALLTLGPIKKPHFQNRNSDAETM